MSPFPQLVSLDQAAALVRRSKKSLYRYRERGMPAPATAVRRGMPHLYDWRQLRPWLEATFGLSLPEDFPGYGPG